MSYHYQNAAQNHATKIVNPVKCGKLKKSGNDTNKLKPRSLKNYRQFKDCKPMHYHTIQINQTTRCSNFSSLLLEVYVSSTCFGCPHTHHQELNNCSSSLWFYHWSVVVAVLLVVVGLVITGPTTTNSTATTTL
jgi:hypothetical protein